MYGKCYALLTIPGKLRLKQFYISGKHLVKPLVSLGMPKGGHSLVYIMHAYYI